MLTAMTQARHGQRVDILAAAEGIAAQQPSCAKPNRA